MKATRETNPPRLDWVILGTAGLPRLNWVILSTVDLANVGCRDKNLDLASKFAAPRRLPRV